MDSLQNIKKEISKICKRLYDKGFSPGWSGNVSIKTEQGILITSSGLNLGDVSENDVVLIDLEGNLLDEGKKASSEKLMHIEIYKKRSDISAIIHCHAPKSSAFAVAGIPLNAPILAENVSVLGIVPIAEYALPSTQKLSENVSNLFLEHDSVLMANHGVVVGGKNLSDAYYKMETLEYYAEVFLYSKILGRSKELSPYEVEQVLALKNSSMK